MTCSSLLGDLPADDAHPTNRRLFARAAVSHPHRAPRVFLSFLLSTAGGPRAGSARPFFAYYFGTSASFCALVLMAPRGEAVPGVPAGSLRFVGLAIAGRVVFLALVVLPRGSG